MIATIVCDKCKKQNTFPLVLPGFAVDDGSLYLGPGIPDPFNQFGLMNDVYSLEKQVAINDTEHCHHCQNVFQISGILLVDRLGIVLSYQGCHCTGGTLISIG